MNEQHEAEDEPGYETYCKKWKLAYTIFVMHDAPQDTWKQVCPIEWYNDAVKNGFPLLLEYLLAKLHGIDDYQAYREFAEKEKPRFLCYGLLKSPDWRKAKYNYMVYIGRTKGGEAEQAFVQAHIPASDSTITRVLHARSAAKALEDKIEQGMAASQHEHVMSASLARVKHLIDSMGLLMYGDIQWSARRKIAPFETVAMKAKDLRLATFSQQCKPGWGGVDHTSLYHKYRMLCNDHEYNGKSIPPGQARDAVEYLSGLAQFLKYQPIPPGISRY